MRQAQVSSPAAMPGQHVAKMLLAEDEHVIEALAAKCPNEPLRERVRPRQPDRRLDHPRAVPGEDAVEYAVMPRTCTVLVWISMAKKTYTRWSSTVSTCRKSQARMPDAWLARNCRHVGDARRGAGPRPAAARIRRIVPSPTRYPRPSSSPWMRCTPSAGSAAPAAPPAPAPRPRPVVAPTPLDRSTSSAPGAGARPAGSPGSRSGAAAGARAAAWPTRRARHGQPSRASGAPPDAAALRPHAGEPRSPPPWQRHCAPAAPASRTPAA
jgi:hypothetical protein